MKSWKAAPKRTEKEDVQQWDAKRGPFTLGEWDVVVNRIQLPIDKLQNDQLTAENLLGRIFLWICMASGKRPIQLLGIEAKDVTPLSNEWVIKVPPAKKQKGRPSSSIAIHDPDLIELIDFYSKISVVKGNQKILNRLLVHPTQPD